MPLDQIYVCGEGMHLHKMRHFDIFPRKMLWVKKSWSQTCWDGSSSLVRSVDKRLVPLASHPRLWNDTRPSEYFTSLLKNSVISYLWNWDTATFSDNCCHIVFPFSSLNWQNQVEAHILESQKNTDKAIHDHDEDPASFRGVCTNIWLKEKTALRSNLQKGLSTMWSEVTECSFWEVGGMNVKFSRMLAVVRNQIPKADWMRRTLCI